MADLLQKEKLLGLTNRRKFHFGKFGSDEVHPRDPLLNGIVPMLERTSASQYFTRQNLGGCRLVFWKEFFAA